MAAATAPPKQRFQGVQKESAGYKLLASMGWKEGEGLGASKQGIKEHIRVKKNYENWGVGAVSRRLPLRFHTRHSGP
jgi:Pin2-interacting protein X1